MSVELSTLHARPALFERAVVALLALLVLLLLGLTGCGRRVARAVAEQGDPEAIPGLIDVGLEGFTPEHHALGARLGEVLEDERLVDDPFDGVDEPEELLVLRVDPAREAAILDELRRRPDVHFAEPVVRVQALWVPDDPQFAQQWHLRAAGATSAWDSARGAGVTAAVIRWAADHGARVLNLSLGGGARSAAMADAVAYARSRGCVVVCAAGNSGGRGVSFPAAYPGALAV